MLGGNREVFAPPMGSVSHLEEVPLGETSVLAVLPGNASQGDGARVGSEAVGGDTP